MVADIDTIKTKAGLLAAEIGDCPACKGYGQFETMTSLSVNGDQGWRIERCEDCDGGKALIPSRCNLCGDEIELADLGYWMDKPAHTECVSNEAIETVTL